MGVFIFEPHLRDREGIWCPARPEDFRYDLFFRGEQNFQSGWLEKQIRIDEEEGIVIVVFGVGDHFVLESSDLPNERVAPGMGRLIACVRMEAASSGDNVDLSRVFICKVLKHFARKRIVIVIYEQIVQRQA